MQLRRTSDRADDADAPEALDFPDSQDMPPSFFDHADDFRWWAGS